jgi:protein ImuA
MTPIDSICLPGVEQIMNKLSLNQLRARLALLESPVGQPDVLPIGLAEIDRVLPWGGLPLGMLHEIGMAEDIAASGPALGLTAILLSRISRQSGKPVLWVSTGTGLYAPGLAAFGLSPDSLVLVRSESGKDGLRAIEDSLRCRGLAAVAGDVRGLDATSARRLHLAARDSGVTALILRRDPGPSLAVTRWWAEPVPSTSAGPDAIGGVGPWRWRLALTRCRGRSVTERGVVGEWLVEWREETHELHAPITPSHQNDRRTVNLLTGTGSA